MTVLPHVQLRAESGTDPLAKLPGSNTPGCDAPDSDMNSPRRSFCRQAGYHLVVWVFLLATAWLSHFSLSHNIGFYSDDQTFAARQLTWTQADFSLWIRTKVVTYPEPQGRPLGFMLGVLFAYWGDKLDGIDGMFVVGCLILSLNAILFYHLLDRCFSKPLPLLGGIAFLLFPADTTRPFLCHQHILQPSLTFMLIAAHLYLGGNTFRRISAYVLVTLCLITYESALLPFAAIPLLEASRDLPWKKRFIRHLGILLVIVAFIGVTRKLGHEYRTEEASGSKAQILTQIFAGSFIGPATAVFSFAYRASTPIYHLFKKPGDLLAFVASAGVFALFLRFAGAQSAVIVPNESKRAIQFGVFALGVSYLLSFTHFPPFYLEGQNTSVHLAAVVGASTLFAVIAAMILRKAGGNLVAISGIAIYLGLLFTAAIAEQRGYITLWRERQIFWTQLTDLCPDLQDGTLVVCDGQLPQPNRFMPASCWSDSMVLEQMYDIPSTFKQMPQVSCFPVTTWRTWLSRDSAGRVYWTKSPYGRAIGDRLIEGKTILLHMDATGAIQRIGGSIDIAGKPFRLRDPVPRTGPPFPALRFYDVLTRNSR